MTSMTRLALLSFFPFLAILVLVAGQVRADRTEKALQVYYLEIVTPDAEAACASLEKVHGVTFGEPQPELGNGRTASLAGGGLLSVRAPMADHEQPVVRPYLLVDDIEAAVEAARDSGGQIAMGATEIPGREGRFAIYFQDGIQYGLWEN